MANIDIPKRLTELRELMKKNKADAYLVPSTDPHKSEYVPDCWQRRRWLSGFTGSAGDMIVTRDWAGLWTDSRYFLQAEAQLLDTGIELMKIGMPDVPSMEDWLTKNLSKGDKLGVDPCLVSPTDERRIKKKLAPAGLKLKYIEDNLVDKIWKGKPRIPTDKTKVMPVKYAGQSTADKLKRLREKMGEKYCRVHIVSALDRIAWLFNLRGTDVEYNPIFIAYAMITDKEAILYLDGKKVTKSVRNALKGLVKIKPYNAIAKDLKELSKRKAKVWIDSQTTNMWIVGKLKGKLKLHKERSPVAMFKACKNKVELQGMRDAHVQDGVAMVKFLMWLEESVPKGNVTEISAANKIDKLRESGDKFVGISFTTISGYAGHGAIVHYSVDKESNVKMKPEGLYLNDDGGQYQNGTTDITRTVCLGKPTKKQIEHFTRVLKGHIQIGSLRFPKGFSGKQIDVLARKALWDVGLNYGHGTGHGIGHYLNVHEGPMSITPRDTGIPLEEGLVLSNEPGFYKAGKYGIRTENVVVLVKDTKFSSDQGEWLMFETITLCPIDLKLVDPNLLSDLERKWLNDYHKTVYETLAPHLGKKAKGWLKKKTKGVRKR